MQKCFKHGFTLFELLIVMAIIAIMAGFGITSVPKLMSGNNVQGAARRLAGAGQEARNMAILQQRPWELLIDISENCYFIGPLGAVKRRELATKNDDFDNKGISLAERSKITKKNINTLRNDKALNFLASYTNEEDNLGIVESFLPEQVEISNIVTNLAEQTNLRVSVVFNQYGFSANTVIWLGEKDKKNNSDINSENFTVYFSALFAPVVARGQLLPDEYGELVESSSANTGSIKQ